MVSNNDCNGYSSNNGYNGYSSKVQMTSENHFHVCMKPIFLEIYHMRN